MRYVRPLSFIGLLLALAGFLPSVADASSLRWPRATELPVADRASRPAVVMLAPGQPPARALRQARSTPQCLPGSACVTCVANCDRQPPATVYARPPVAAETAQQRTAAAEAVSSGRPGWADISCGSQGGCSVAGIIPVRPRHSETVVTVIGNFYYSK